MTRLRSCVGLSLGGHRLFVRVVDLHSSKHFSSRTLCRFRRCYLSGVNIGTWKVVVTCIYGGNTYHPYRRVRDIIGYPSYNGHLVLTPNGT